jgi:hypothetical protein
MRVYTYSEARRNLASLLDRAAEDGEVRIRRRDGQVFILQVAPRTKSPLDVEGVPLDVSAAEIVEIVCEGRERDLHGGDPPSKDS